jgi:hypothetical protein
MSVAPPSIAETGFLLLASGEAFLIDLERASAEVLLEIAEKTRGLAAQVAAKGCGLRSRADVPGIFSAISPSTIPAPLPLPARALRLPDLAARTGLNPTRAS